MKDEYNVEAIVDSSADQIFLGCSRQELGKMTPLIEAEYIWAEIPGISESEPHLLHPYVIPLRLATKQESLPSRELCLHRGAGVQATDGKVGRVDEFVVIPTNGQITHLLLREGHLWGRREVAVPISEIDRIQGKTVHLKLDKNGVRALPSVPVRRLWS